MLLLSLKKSSTTNDKLTSALDFDNFRSKTHKEISSKIFIMTAKTAHTHTHREKSRFFFNYILYILTRDTTSHKFSRHGFATIIFLNFTREKA